MPDLPALNPTGVLLALAAGLVSFISPCVLPLVPAYLGYITGLSAEELRGAGGYRRLAVGLHGAAFVAGLVVVFTLLGASATLLGQTLLQNQPLLLKLGGVLVIVFGLHMLGVIRIPLLYRTASVSDVGTQAARGGYSGAFLMGLAFGAGWTPCIGPFLAGILTLAAAEETVLQGTILLLIYALGLGIPFLVAALAVDRSLSLMNRLKPYLGRIEQVAGLLLVGMGILLFTERFTLVTIWLTRVFGTGWAL